MTYLNALVQSAFLVAKCCSFPVKSNLIRIDPLSVMSLPGGLGGL